MIYTSAPIRLNKSVDGQTPYIHIKYSDDGGLTFTPYEGETPGKYMGLYADYTKADPTDVSKYKWSLIQGADGAPGTPGKDGTSVTILGSYDSEDELNAAHPTGELGDSYIVNGDLYVWDGSAWKNAGTIQGPSGEDGVGVDSIKTQFYLSTAKTAPTGGSWVETMPTWSTGKYLWTRSKITYTDGTIAYTSPICDSSWEAVDELDKKLDYEEVLNRLTDGGRIKGLFFEDDFVCLNADCIRAIEELFAKDITMTGKFECTSETYLPPTYDDVIYTLWAVYFPDQYPLPSEYSFDLNGDGVFDEDDAIMAKRVYMGEIPMSKCPGAVKTSATIRIDLSNPARAICIYGINMWGTQVESTISIDASNSSFASKADLQRMINQEPDSTILYRTVDKEKEYVNPPMTLGVEYRTTERFDGKVVYAKTVNIGTLPGKNGEIHVSHGASVANMLRCTGTTKNGGIIPYTYNNGTTFLINISASSTSINVWTADNDYADYSDTTGTATIWYTKD